MNATLHIASMFTGQYRDRMILTAPTCRRIAARSRSRPAAGQPRRRDIDTKRTVSCEPLVSPHDKPSLSSRELIAALRCARRVSSATRRPDAGYAQQPCSVLHAVLTTDAEVGIRDGWRPL